MFLNINRAASSAAKQEEGVMGNVSSVNPKVIVNQAPKRPVQRAEPKGAKGNFVRLPSAVEMRSQTNRELGIATKVFSFFVWPIIVFAKFLSKHSSNAKIEKDANRDRPGCSGCDRYHEGCGDPYNHSVNVANDKKSAGCNSCDNENKGKRDGDDGTQYPMHF